jgi:hypothetical protein
MNVKITSSHRFKEVFAKAAGSVDIDILATIYHIAKMNHRLDIMLFQIRKEYVVKKSL